MKRNPSILPIIILSVSLLGCFQLVKNNDESVAFLKTRTSNSILEVENIPMSYATMGLNFTTPFQGVQKQPSGKLVYSVSDDGYLNIRRSPSAQAEIVGRLLTGGSGANLLGTQGKWYKVSYKGTVGYVNSSYASLRKPTPKKVYYLVLGSYDSPEKAQNATNNLPDALLSPVYKATEKGVTKYRICSHCFNSREKAERKKKNIETLLNLSAWIWESDGLAECVYRPGSLVDEKIKIPELTPQ